MYENCKYEALIRIKMNLFSRKPLSNTEYNRSDHSIVNKTCDSYIIKIPHTRLGKQDSKANMLAFCWCYNFIFSPHITNWGDTHLCRKVTRFYINLQRAGCQSARCLNPTRDPTTHHQGVEIRNGLSNTNLQNYCSAIMALYSVETLS